jgi:hypothetical protein
MSEKMILDKAQKEYDQLQVRRQESEARIFLEKENIARVESEYFLKMSIHAGKIHKEYQQITIMNERLKLLSDVIRRRAKEEAEDSQMEQSIPVYSKEIPNCFSGDPDVRLRYDEREEIAVPSKKKELVEEEMRKIRERQQREIKKDLEAASDVEWLTKYNEEMDKIEQETGLV